VLSFDAMSLVFHLPLDLITELLSVWVGLIEVSKLDRCISQLFVRRKFLDVVSSPAVIYEGVEVNCLYSGGYFAWLYHRNISINKIVICRGEHSIDPYFLQDKVCRHVKVLDFSAGPQMAAFELAPVIAVCPNLEEFAYCEFGYRNIIDEKVVTALRQYCGNLNSFTLVNNRMLVDRDIELLVKECTKLRHLHFHSCFGVGAPAMKAVTEHCPRLQSLTLKTMEAVGEEGLTALASQCHSITSLNLIGMVYLTAGVHRLVSENPLLTELSLAGVVISDETLTLIGSTCPGLKRLVLSRSVGFSDAGVLALIEACAQLIYLDIRFCPRLSQDMWQRIEQIPNRQIECPPDV
jgi:hypothetical protein